MLLNCADILWRLQKPDVYTLIEQSTMLQHYSLYCVTLIEQSDTEQKQQDFERAIVTTQRTLLQLQLATTGTKLSYLSTTTILSPGL